jgi:surface antigen
LDSSAGIFVPTPFVWYKLPENEGCLAMNKPKILATMSVLALTVSACAPQHGDGVGRPSDESVGAVIGGIAGGFLGSQFGEGSGKTVAAVTGALLGAWAGSQIATNMTRRDRSYYDQAAQQAQSAPIGQQITWYNPESGNQGSITPTREGQATSGSYCREYQQTITVDGKTERAYGTACRQPDGSWKIVE